MPRAQQCRGPAPRPGMVRARMSTLRSQPGVGGPALALAGQWLVAQPMGSQGSCGPSHARRRPRSRPSTVTAPGGARTPREGRGPGPGHEAHTCSSADSRLLSDVRFITSPRALSNLIRGRSFRDTCTCICRDSSITRGPKASAVRLPDSRGSAAPAPTHPRTQLPGAAFPSDQAAWPNRADSPAQKAPAREAGTESSGEEPEPSRPARPAAAGRGGGAGLSVPRPPVSSPPVPRPPHARTLPVPGPPVHAPPAVFGPPHARTPGPGPLRLTGLRGELSRSSGQAVPLAWTPARRDREGAARRVAARREQTGQRAGRAAQGAEQQEQGTRGAG